MLQENEFLKGYVSALALLASLHDQPSVALDILNQGGFSTDRKVLEAGGASKFDLDLIFKSTGPNGDCAECGQGMKHCVCAA